MVSCTTFLFVLMWLSCQISGAKIHQKIISRNFATPLIPKELTKILFESTCPVKLAQSLKQKDSLKNIQKLLDSGETFGYDTLPLKLCLTTLGIDFVKRNKIEDGENRVVIRNYVSDAIIDFIKEPVSDFPKFCEEFLWVKLPSPHIKKLLWDNAFEEKTISKAQSFDIAIQREDYFAALMLLRPNQVCMLPKLMSNIAIKKDHLAGWMSVMACGLIDYKTLLLGMDEKLTHCKETLLSLGMFSILIQKHSSMSLKKEKSNTFLKSLSRQAILNFLCKNGKGDVKFLSDSVRNHDLYGLLCRRDVPLQKLLVILRHIPIDRKNGMYFQKMFAHMVREKDFEDCMSILKVFGLELVYMPEAKKVSPVIKTRSKIADDETSVKALAYFAAAFLFDGQLSSGVSQLDSNQNRLGYAGISLKVIENRFVDKIYQPSQIIPLIPRIFDKDGKYMKDAGLNPHQISEYRKNFEAGLQTALRNNTAVAGLEIALPDQRKLRFDIEELLGIKKQQPVESCGKEKPNTNEIEPKVRQTPFNSCRKEKETKKNTTVKVIKAKKRLNPKKPKKLERKNPFLSPIVEETMAESSDCEDCENESAISPSLMGNRFAPLVENYQKSANDRLEPDSKQRTQFETKKDTTSADFIDKSSPMQSNSSFCGSLIQTNGQQETKPIYDFEEKGKLEEKDCPQTSSQIATKKESIKIAQNLNACEESENLGAFSASNLTIDENPAEKNGYIIKVDSKLDAQTQLKSSFSSNISNNISFDAPQEDEKLAARDVFEESSSFTNSNCVHHTDFKTFDHPAPSYHVEQRCPSRIPTEIFQREFYISPNYYDGEEDCSLYLFQNPASQLVIKNEFFEFKPVLLGYCPCWRGGAIGGAGSDLYLTFNFPSGYTIEHYHSYLIALIKPILPNIRIISCLQ